jgi:hypothetical protein
MTSMRRTASHSTCSDCTPSLQQLTSVGDPGSEFSIPDPGSIFFPSQIPEFKYFKPKQWFLNSQKYDPSCSSRIRTPDLDPDFLPIPDTESRIQGVKKAPDPGSGSATVQLSTVILYWILVRSGFKLGPRIRIRKTDSLRPLYSILDN